MTVGRSAKIDTVREAVREVIDPELGISVVDLGLVRGIDVQLVWQPPWDPAVDATDDVRAELGMWL